MIRAMERRHEFLSLHPVIGAVVWSFYSCRDRSCTLLPVEFLSKVVAIPLLYSKLAACVNDLQRALGLSVLSDSQLGSHAASMRSCLQVIQSFGLSTDTMQESQMTGYVAGGYVVSSVLGFGPHGDIDVFMRPFRNRQPSLHLSATWVVICSKSCYPVNTIACNNPLDSLATFDLDICQCAIKIEFCRGLRTYELLFSDACIVAYSQRVIHSIPLHPALAEKQRLGDRLVKYRLRGLRLLTSHLRGVDREVALFREADFDDPATRQLAHLLRLFEAPPGVVLNSVPCYWHVVLGAQFVKRCSFECGKLPMSAVRLPPSVPGLLYPCQRNKKRRLVAFPDLPDTHWLLRSMFGCGDLVAMPSLGKFRSSAMKPVSMLDHCHLSYVDYLQVLKRSHGVSIPHGVVADCNTSVVIPCDYAVRPLLNCIDWKLPTFPNDPNYGHLWTWIMDRPIKTPLQATMFCVDSRKPVEVCRHDHEQCLARSGVM